MHEALLFAHCSDQSKNSKCLCFEYRSVKCNFAPRPGYATGVLGYWPWPRATSIFFLGFKRICPRNVDSWPYPRISFESLAWNVGFSAPPLEKTLQRAMRILAETIIRCLDLKPWLSSAWRKKLLHRWLLGFTNTLHGSDKQSPYGDKNREAYAAAYAPYTSRAAPCCV